LRRCLQKDRSQRLQTAADARIRIDDAAEPEAVHVPADQRVHKRRLSLAWIVAIAATATAAVLAIALFRMPQFPDPTEMRLEINLPISGDPLSFALSPDGKQLAYVASGDAGLHVWLRSLVTNTSQVLPGTEGAARPFWSPDSRSLAFFADGQLKRVELDGGSPQVLAQAFPWPGTWNADGVILFSRNALGPLFRISASGGEITAAPSWIASLQATDSRSSCPMADNFCSTPQPHRKQQGSIWVRSTRT
jgi:hypothetical protein